MNGVEYIELSCGCRLEVHPGTTVTAWLCLHGHYVEAFGCVELPHDVVVGSDA